MDLRNFDASHKHLGNCGQLPYSLRSVVCQQQKVHGFHFLLHKKSGCGRHSSSPFLSSSKSYYIFSAMFLFSFRGNNNNSWRHLLLFTQTIKNHLISQASIVICQHYFLTSHFINPRSRAGAFYIWNVLSPLWTTLSRASDLIILFMTIDRYKIMRNIDQVRLA